MKKIKKFIYFILFVVIIILIYYLYYTINFINKIKVDYQIEKYYVIIKSNSKYKSLEDLTNKTIGIYKDNNIDEALNNIDINLNIKEYEYYMDSYNDLLNNNIDSIILSESYKSMIDDIDDKVRVIYTINIKLDNNIEASNNIDSFNIYISGIDTYGDITKVSRSDSNMIVTINTKTNEILLTSIPRDYYVKLYNIGYKDKLAHTGIYGINMSINTIEDLLNIDIDYYVRVNFNTIINLVDIIGGIDIFNTHLDGKSTLEYVRERYTYIDGDRHRIKNQQEIVKAIINKLISSKTLITKYTSILDSLENNFQTNIPIKNIYTLVDMQLKNNYKWNIDSYYLDGSDSKNYTYSIKTKLLYVMEPDIDTINKANYKINKVLNEK